MKSRCRILIIVFCFLGVFKSIVVGQNGSNTISPEEYQRLLNFADHREALGKAKSVIDTVLKLNKFLSDITAEDLIRFPLALKVEFNNVKYILAIQQANIRPSYTDLEVYAAIIGPKDSLFFGSPSVKFSGSGGIVGDIYLGLLHDYVFNVGKQKARITLKKITGDQGCFVKFDCDGFKELAMDALVEFSRDIILPVDQLGNPIKEKNVTSSFSTRIRDFNDWVVDISVPNFTLTSYPKVAFSVEHAIIDWSDTYNDPDIIFPAGYFDMVDNDDSTVPTGQGVGMLLMQDEGVGGNNQGNSGNNNNSNTSGGSTQPDQSPIWRGFYIRKLRVILPPEFMKRDSGTRVAVEARNMLIDSRGVSGEFEVQNIITLEEGRMQKWAYSLDKLTMDFLQSKLQVLTLKGRVELPIAKEQQTLNYTGQYNHLRKAYTLCVGLEDTLQFPVWKVATVTLNPSSFVKITLSEDVFYPYAKLTGSMSIYNNEGSSEDIDAPGIEFQNLELSTQAPYINIEYLGLSSEVHLNGTPITINEIGIAKKDDKIGIYLNVDCNMEEGSESGISASMGAAIYGKLSDNVGKQKFVFDKLEIKDGSLSATFPGFEFYGSFRPFNSNATYGSGFEAKLKIAVDLKKTKKANTESNAKKEFSFEVDAFGIFGNVNGSKYWAVDLAATFSPCISIGSFAICGFMGGAYRRMAIIDTDQDPEKLGVSTKGNLYAPKQNVGLGIRAGINFQLSGTKSVSGEAMLQFQFSESGGLQQILFEGYAEFQVSVEKFSGLAKNLKNIAKYSDLGIDDLVGVLKKENKERAKNSGNGARANVRIDLNFEQQRYSGLLDFNITLFENLVTGKAQADMLADFKNNKFHFYLGTFMIPMHVRAQLGNLYAEVKAYIMFGNDIPGFPSIDPRIASFLGISVDKRKTDAMNYQANVETGSGMLFGAGVDISFEDCKWFGVNIRVKANFLAGFDAGFLKFSDQKRCNNGSKFGIDQWYNMARFYLLINFEAGRFRKCEKRYSHWGNLNIGAFLEGQFPNPVYLEGKFVFRMCGFHINFKFKKGERCGL